MHDDVDDLPLTLSEQPWLEEILGAADLPTSVDREGAALALANLLGRPISPETLRRWPIPYKVVAGCARYEVSDLIAHAKAEYANAPRRMGRRSLRRDGLVQSCPGQSDKGEQTRGDNCPGEMSRARKCRGVS